MGDPLSSLPDDPRLFDGPPAERFIALALETLVHDMSPVGDDEMAKRLGSYTLGEAPPPEDAPRYVDLEDGHISMSNPPFLLAEIDVRGREGYVLDVGFDSELNLLIDPPVRVTIEGSLPEVVETLEQTVAQIYRTKGRYLEMLHSGTAEPG